MNLLAEAVGRQPTDFATDANVSTHLHHQTRLVKVAHHGYS